MTKTYTIKFRRTDGTVDTRSIDAETLEDAMIKIENIDGVIYHFESEVNCDCPQCTGAKMQPGNSYFCKKSKSYYGVISITLG